MFSLSCALSYSGDCVGCKMPKIASSACEHVWRSFLRHQKQCIWQEGSRWFINFYWSSSVHTSFVPSSRSTFRQRDPCPPRATRMIPLPEERKVNSSEGKPEDDNSDQSLFAFLLRWGRRFAVAPVVFEEGGELVASTSAKAYSRLYCLALVALVIY